jgi:hypothetical protein
MQKIVIWLLVFAITIPTYSQDNSKKTRGLMNPDISMNALLLYKIGSRTNTINTEQPNGLNLQEAELAFYSDVDPYTKFMATLAISQEAVARTAPASGFDRSYIIEPEELFFETTAIDRMTLKGGKIKAAIGKENQLHTHAYSFIDSSQVVSSVLGGEGINEIGFSASYLIPLPWFSELSLQALYPHNDDSSALLNYPHANSVVRVERLKNLWDLTENSTIEFNISFAQAKRQSSDGATPALYADKSVDLVGADFAYKWREDKEHAFVWSTEFLQNHFGTYVGKMHNYAVTTNILWQFSSRWWLGGRAEFVENKTVDSGVATYDRIKKYSALASFNPSEFSSYRLQLDQLHDGQDQDEKRAMLQFNFTIGAHPSHAY